MNACDPLFDAPPEWAENDAVIDADSGRRYTYRQLQDAVRAFAQHLRFLGARPGQVLATHLYNGADAVIAHMGIQFTGCISCLLDPLIPPDALAYYLRDSGARFLVTHLNIEKVAGSVPPGTQVLQSGDVAERSRAVKGPGEVVFPAPFDPDGVAAIFYTSGTTHRPKGVLLSPGNFFAHVRIFREACYRYVPGDRLLCFVPFSHGYGSKSIFLPCLHDGAAMVLLRSFQPVRVAEVVGQEKITHIFGVPSHYQQLLRREEFLRPMRSLKAAFCAAAVLKTDTARSWYEHVGIHLDEGYGLIETCTGVAFRRGRLPDRAGDIGTYPHGLVEVGVVDDNFQPLPPGERGEIVVRGESVMKGYLNRPDETAYALRDGWFRTGDLGYRTADNGIVLAGRIKDVINVAGIKVAPFEVEAALNEHQDVSESAVVGVRDATYGEVVKAFVKLRGGAAGDEREILRYLQKRLMNFQVPKSIEFVEDFPRNTMGKIDKKALRAMEGGGEWTA